MSGTKVAQKSSRKRVSKRNKRKVPDAVFAQMTEEEKIAWAVNLVNMPVKILRRNASTQIKKEKLVKIYREREKRSKSYKGNSDIFLEKKRMLYNHNEERREEKKYRSALVAYKKRFMYRTGWLERYYRTYSPKLEKYMDTYILKDGYEEYYLGISVVNITKLLPIGPPIVARLIEANVMPKPVKIGYLFKKNSIAEVATEFYSLEEAREILKIWYRYWSKARSVDEDDQRLWLKQKFWKTLLKVRNEERSN